MYCDDLRVVISSLLESLPTVQVILHPKLVVAPIAELDKDGLLGTALQTPEPPMIPLLQKESLVYT